MEQTMSQKHAHRAAVNSINQGCTALKHVSLQSTMLIGPALTSLFDSLHPIERHMVLPDTPIDDTLTDTLTNLCTAHFPRQKSLMLIKGEKTETVLVLFADRSGFLMHHDGAHLRLLPSAVNITNQNKAHQWSFLMRGPNNRPSLRLKHETGTDFVHGLDGLSSFAHLPPAMRALPQDIDRIATVWIEAIMPCLPPNLLAPKTTTHWNAHFPYRGCAADVEPSLQHIFAQIGAYLSSFLPLSTNQEQTLILFPAGDLTLIGTNQKGQMNLHEIQLPTYLEAHQADIASTLAQHTSTGRQYTFHLQKGQSPRITSNNWPKLESLLIPLASNHEILEARANSPLENASLNELLHATFTQ